MEIFGIRIGRGEAEIREMDGGQGRPPHYDKGGQGCPPHYDKGGQGRPPHYDKGGQGRPPHRRNERKYRFLGVVWEHKPVTTEQWSMMQEIIGGREQGSKGEREKGGEEGKEPPLNPPATGVGGEMDIRSRLMARGTMERVLAVLLIPEHGKFHAHEIDAKAEMLREFPAEWGLEVIGDFFRWNPVAGGIIQMYMIMS